MLMNNVLKAGDVWEINNEGSAFAVVRSSLGLRVKMFNKSGEAVLDSDVVQGINLADIHYASLYLYAERDMRVTVWVGKYKYGYTPQPERASVISSYTVPTRPGVNKLMDFDPPRLRAMLQAPFDIWIGGDDMTGDYGSVKNGRLFKGGSEIELTNFGDIYYFISAENKRVFQSQSIQLPYVSKWLSHNNDRPYTRSQLEGESVPYFDVFIPDELDNTPFDLKIDDTVKTYPWTEAGSGVYEAGIWATVGDINTETLTLFKYDRSVNTSKAPTPEGDTNWPYGDKTLSVTLSKGWHRLFMACVSPPKTTAIENGHANFTPSVMYFESVFTNQDALLSLGDVQILEERA
ncbi:hypothetical protein CBQ28_02190 [Pseudoalteromonas sp. GCY]|uniref:hypothetical protein n=1 Tax=Pseudoalteromonas sp. GCY TaxID=2003316 RepID=UPI000BFEAC7D|nr:hypothetical protein [Pseudoalteromonas sp. GCY]PHI38840.1 hypothetical protein CBQ28_02190 [Pseudoalteromonas sp. GCY]QQQ65936.1 hypothetical protein JJQ94_16685 [Pseudoalteromonas sp. GCY]